MQTIEAHEAKKAAIAEIMELRESFVGAFEGENIKALIEEGRR